jgi:DNA-binding MarR family transcriptional regulator
MASTHSKSSLSDLLLIFRRNILANIKKEIFGHDLTFSQAEILHFIGTSGKETMKNIADHLRITPPSATEVVAEMEKKGLVVRKNDKKDRRVVFIVLTPMAKKFSASLYRHKESILKKIFFKLNKKDRKEFERIIKILITT